MQVSSASTPDVEVRGVQLADHVGPGEHEHLVAALEVGAPEVVGGEVPGLDARAEGAVEDDHALGRGVEIAAVRHSHEATGVAPAPRSAFGLRGCGAAP